MSNAPSAPAPAGPIDDALGGLPAILDHLHRIRLSGMLSVDTAGGPALIEMADGEIRAARLRDRTGLAAVAGAALLGRGYRLLAPRRLGGDEIGLMTPVVLDRLRQAAAEVRRDLARSGLDLPLDAHGSPIPTADAGIERILDHATVTVRRRDGDAAADAGEAGEFPADFARELLGGARIAEPPAGIGEPAWVEPMVGQMLGKCYLSAELGRGATAIVYRAMHLSLKIDVAVKVFIPAAGSGEIHLSQREAQIMARLNHPGIVRVLDCADRAPYPHLVIEYVDGTNLSTLIAQAGRLDAASTVGIVGQAAAALAYAHGEGVIHCDIKPGNLLIDRRQAVKLSDLGVARIAGNATASDARAVIGTPAYIAPELVRNGIAAAGAASDIYSLGATFYHAIAGQPPFHHADPLQTMVMQVQAPLRPPRDVVAGLDPAIDALIVRMLAKDPAERPGYGELAAELRTLRDRCVDRGAIGPGLRAAALPAAIFTTIDRTWKHLRRRIDRILGRPSTPT